MTDIYDALEDCLSAVARGASVDQALKRYPKQAGELRGLLEASLLAREAGRVHVPLDVRRRGRARLLQEAHAAKERRAPAARSRIRIIPFFPRVALTAGLAAALVLTSTGLVSASSTSLPGQHLYPVKRTWESVRLLLAFSPQERDLIESDYEQERLDEISELLGKRMSATITFSGLLGAQANGQWTVSGIPVLVGSNTVLPSAPVAGGAPVTVSGVTRPDGVVEAQAIQLLQSGAALPPLEPSEADEHKGQRESEDGTPGAVTAAPTTQAPAPTPATPPATYKFTGVVQSMQGNLWRINGQPVYVDTAQITGQITVGSLVKFQGYYSANGQFVVTTLGPQSSSSDSKKSGSDSSDNSGEHDNHEGGDDGP